MIRKTFYAACGLFALVAVSCNQAEEPAATVPEEPASVARAATIDNFARVVYVEVNDVNPLNVLSYKLSNGDYFFTHVILFASNIRGDASGNVHNYNNPNNAAILDGNPGKYIAPIRAAGIKVLMGNLGDHTGAGFSNLTAAQINTYTNDLVAYENIVDGWDFDDEWAEYGTRGYPNSNTTSYSNMILALDGKSTKMITVFDYIYERYISATAAAKVDLAYNSGLNSYNTSPGVPVPLSRYCPLFVDLTDPMSDSNIRTFTAQARVANAGGVCFFNLPMAATKLSSLNAAAQAFGLTCTHTGTTYSKDYGSN